jgi:hypothetical protein
MRDDLEPVPNGRAGNLVLISCVIVPVSVAITVFFVVLAVRGLWGFFAVESCGAIYLAVAIPATRRRHRQEGEAGSSRRA